MTRKEFVKHISVLFLGIFGFYNFVSQLKRLSDDPEQFVQVEKKGFGASKFGV